MWNGENEKHKTATLLYGEDYKEIDLIEKDKYLQLIQRPGEVHRIYDYVLQTTTK